MAILRFTSVIEIRDGNPYVPVSAARARRIKPDWRKPMPVRVRINGKPSTSWRINMMPVGGGGFYLYLHGIVRKASRTEVGHRVEVELAFDERYRNGPMHAMPPEFKGALQKNRSALENWEALVPSRKKEVLRYFAALKSPEARARNLERALHVLSGKKGRFLGRSWG
jgi:hypothetical protein